MKRKRVQAVAVHPRLGAVVLRPGVCHFEAGKITKRFERLAEAVAERYAEAFRKLAK
jgi:hypothetical protein